MSRPPNDSGFSLVEALTALAVFALAGVGLVQLQTQSLASFARVETRALADLAAQNRLALIAAAREKPAPGQREERIDFAGRAWVMTTSVSAVGDGALSRVAVSVRAEADAAPAATAHAFFASPEAAP